IGKATERIFLVPIKMTMVPEIVDMELPVEGVFHNLAIVKIKKEYPGQAIKVMHSMWGAGQMMFNKFMIVVDGDVDIHNYEAVARYISANTNPETDIHFTQGPVDVLDHSCSVMAFGGKMGIDATRKMPEERIPTAQTADESEVLKVKSLNFEHRTPNFKLEFPEIHDINDSLLQKGISILFMSVEKNRKNHLRELSEKLSKHNLFAEIKMILFLDHTVDITSVADAVWRFTNNVDPKRDSFIFSNHIAMDGTRKTKELDGFDRDWPNILCSDEKTIQRVDEIWDKLGLGKFISSPSLRYRSQLYKGGAVVTEQ
ncbi:MAG: UbiD family decarboxylase, partial [Bacteroidia bacterium]|nr:UbiD family decarboxylase [Bacteroidia bacterium]